MQQHVFQLDSGEEFTIPAWTLADAWRKAIDFLVDADTLAGVASLAYNGTR